MQLTETLLHYLIANYSEVLGNPKFIYRSKRNKKIKRKKETVAH